MSLISLARRGRVVAVLAGALLLVPVLAEARPGGKGGFGSRGTRTYSAPAPTNTAPNGAQPFQRSTAPTPSPSMAGPAAGAAGAAAQAARPSMARNLMMGVGAGLLGAGLFGMLSGAGFFSGLASLAGILGFLLQIALIGGAIFLAIRFFRRRSEPQLATAGGPMAREAIRPQSNPRAGMMGAAMGATGGGAAGSKPVEITLDGEDFNHFERLLGEINTAYSNENQQALAERLTPEMAGYFADDIAENAGKGLVDRVSDVKLLQGDLSEAWREDNFEYATVAMRFSLINALTERATGRVVDGNATTPQEVSEHWTFVRSRGGPWKLSGIQQAA